MKQLRRLHFQLTPLLDLLLIVIFAQYLEVRETSGEQAAHLEAEQREVQSELAAGKKILDARADQLRTKEAELEKTEELLSEESKRLLADRAELFEQQSRAAKLMAKLFDLPEDVAKSAFEPQQPPLVPQTPEDAARLQAELERLAAGKSREVIDHLLTYDELRKRADVWGLHVRDTGEIVFSANDRSVVLRASDPEQFASRLFASYKALPQPKGLVVMLVSYGDARADARATVLEGLPLVLRELREDRLGKTQFEYAVLGYVPGDPPEIR
ncbi:hypothetical protein [Calycomorphotria hydatis]|uniref:Uncharacterized protein n=1 Tax=Calycomorphotria hydatis TaxID=2528027 RepID=A0A517TAD9_9PLAN|nr:hypothetical protein [Calycomorphotria hydatis]QDT65336.1 hypothetical protein V22_25850 [Calycomorphotria hydatis]